MMLNKLLPAVLAAGDKAKAGQKGIARTYKRDGSVLTHIDTELNAFLCKNIHENFPDANIISEEDTAVFRAGREYTFTVDPIDGTESYSQGQPGWCIAIGLLDKDLEPVGGIIYAPRWSTSSSCETLVVSEPGGLPTVNGEAISPDMNYASDPEKSQVMISSSLHKSIDMSKYPGKLKNSGCAVLNLLSIATYPNVICALATPLHIWDIAASHSVLKALGLDLEYYNNDSIQYEYLLDGELTHELILAGSSKSIQTTKNFLKQVNR